jgi:hypothetical protein
LDGRGVAAAAVAEESVDTFLRGRRRRRAPRAEDRSTLLRLLAHLAAQGIICTPSAERTPTAVEQIEAEYVDYMRHERNLAPATIRSNRITARNLLTFLFANGPLTFDSVRTLHAESSVEFGRSYGSRFTAAGSTPICLRTYRRLLFGRNHRSPARSRTIRFCAPSPNVIGLS